jgi:hypothetical protein
MEQKINQLIESIEEAFTDVKLGDGVSWREADVIDSYGSIEERKLARDQDVKDNWRKIPDSLIGDLKYQCVLPSLDAKGLRFYLAPCMIFTLKYYKESPSLITHSIIYSLTHEATVNELESILSPKQKACVINFLELSLQIGEDYFDLFNTETNLKNYWIEKI